jgi:hypothetical protein
MLVATISWRIWTRTGAMSEDHFAIRGYQFAPFSNTAASKLSRTLCCHQTRTPAMSVSDVFLGRDCVRAIRAAMIDSKQWDERAIDFIVEVIRTARAP